METEGLYPFLEKICKDGAVNYFNLVLDPTSFGSTAENIYIESCPAYEGKVSYKDEAVGLLCLNTVSESKRRRPENSEEHRFVISIDTDHWKELIEALKKKEPMLVLN